jgi:hypothetical protein
MSPFEQEVVYVLDLHMNKSVISIHGPILPHHQHHHFSMAGIFSIVLLRPCGGYMCLSLIHQFPSIMFHDLILCINPLQSQPLIAVPCLKQ